MESPDIWIIGSGNVAWHLAHALKRSGRTIAGIYSPTEKHSRSLGGELHIPVLSGLSDIPDRGIVILAVPDDAVPVLASSFDLHQALLVHTSGSVDMRRAGTTNIKYWKTLPSRFPKTSTERKAWKGGNIIWLR